MTVINRARTRARTVLSGLVHAPVAAAPDVSRYRAYVLESSLDAIVEDSGVRASDVQMVHERPAMIHELEWRPPFLISDRELADPVHDITFRFYDRVLYQMTVSYDRARTDALTSKDIIDALTIAYGSPISTSPTSRGPTVGHQWMVLAQWENDSSSVTLFRPDPCASEFKLILMSKALIDRARDAIREAARLDAIEAPRRAVEQRNRQLTADDAAHEQTRATNKAAFRA